MKKHSSSASATIKDLKDGLNSLYKTVYQGNGVPSIISQITKLNEKVSSLEESVDDKFSALNTEISLKFKNITDVVTEKFANLSDQIDKEFDKEKIVLDKKYSHRTALFTTIIASISSIVVLFLSEIVKKIHY